MQADEREEELECDGKLTEIPAIKVVKVEMVIREASVEMIKMRELLLKIVKIELKSSQEH